MGLREAAWGSGWSQGPLNPRPWLPASTSEEGWTDGEVDSSCSGQPIHLWQFLKELLLKPHSYGRFIRWLNKEKGTIHDHQGGAGLEGGVTSVRGTGRWWEGPEREGGVYIGRGSGLCGQGSGC